MKRALVLVLAAGLAAGCAAQWQPAAGPLKTRWTDQVTPENAHREYPRPQLVRERWENLNGLWQWARAVADEAPPFGKELPGRILVPFPIESMLSGVGEHAERIWYRRTFQRPAGERVLLHFEAVDWEATVWVNGKEVGQHRGGYDPFTFDITEALKPEGEQELIVRVFDPTDAGDQPRGKQVREPKGIWYTPVTGIWQTVWLEPVPRTSVADLVLRPDIDVDAAQLVVRVEIRGPLEGQRVLAMASNPVLRQQRARGGVPEFDAGEVARAEAAAGSELRLEIPKPQLWSPAEPFLYDLRVELRRGDQVVDVVTSYFGMRKIEVRQELTVPYAKPMGGRPPPSRAIMPCLLLNGELSFQVGPLDQGYWPDGLYTAPTDEALRYDLEVTKQLGFNATRKHVKVEPRRWYYWADRLGVLVWQDMPSGDNKTPESRQQFEVELRRLVETHRNHPSIVMWIVFNEGWGQHDTRRLTALVKELDRSRLVSNASGWTDEKCGDVLDIHSYPAPAKPPPSSRRAVVLGEFGGLGLGVDGHVWKPQHWGYQAVRDGSDLTLHYEQMLRQVHGMHGPLDLMGAIYTQITDVEIECNGLLTYDRKVIKPDVARVAAANRGDFTRAARLVPVVPAADAGAGAEWAYTLEPPGEGWETSGFDDRSWQRGMAGFGTQGTPGACVGTEWKSTEIWLRRGIELPEAGLEDLRLWIHHDEDAEVFVNGVLATSLKGYTTGYRAVALSALARTTLKAGKNLIAVHCKQTRGGQYIDLGFVRVEVPGTEKRDDEEVPNPSFESVAGDVPAHWFRSRWRGEATLDHANEGRNGARSVAIAATKGADVAWSCYARVQPLSRYRLSGWIKTEDVVATTGRGALLNLHGTRTATPALTGSNDWTRVEVELETGYEDALHVNCLFGGWGLATGKAWFDDLRLECLKTQPLPEPKITVDATKRGAPISPWIYGQFIEHLGRCIQGGIWAEMLEDRKFFWPVGAKESPWQPIGGGDAVTMTRDEPFSGEHAPRISLAGDAPRGLQQSGLGVVKDQGYLGRIWLRGSAGAGPVHVSLSYGEGGDPRQTVTINEVTSTWRPTKLVFCPEAGTEAARLIIVATGQGHVDVGPVSLMPSDNADGLRADTLELLRELDAPVYRWPGGNFVSGYDWKDGIGERDRRPPRKNPAWQGVEPNDFGLHEFMNFCRRVKAEPYVAVNAGLGQAEAARQLVEYCNGADDTPQGRLRVANASTLRVKRIEEFVPDVRPPGFAVRFWGIGNEMYGDWQLGHMPVARYALKHNEFARAMRAADPSIEIVGVGEVGPWDEAMLTHCADSMTYLSEHIYVQERPSLLAHSRLLANAIRAKAERHRDYRKRLPSLQGKDIRIVMDEWNHWYGPHAFGELGTRYFLKDALGVASGLHEFFRQSDLFVMANYAQTVNVIGCIKTSKARAAFETTGLVLALYRRHFGTIPVVTESTPQIDAMAAWSADGSALTVGIVNPSLERRTVTLELRGATVTGRAKRFKIAGNDPLAHNDPDQPPRVTIGEGECDVTAGQVDLAPCSVSLLVVPVR